MDRHIYFRQALSLSPGISRLGGRKVLTLIRGTLFNCSQMHVVLLDLYTFCNFFVPCFKSYPTLARPCYEYIQQLDTMQMEIYSCVLDESLGSEAGNDEGSAVADCSRALFSSPCASSLID